MPGRSFAPSKCWNEWVRDSGALEPLSIESFDVLLDVALNAAEAGARGASAIAIAALECQAAGSGKPRSAEGGRSDGDPLDAAIGYLIQRCIECDRKGRHNCVRDELNAFTSLMNCVRRSKSPQREAMRLLVEEYLAGEKLACVSDFLVEVAAQSVPVLEERLEQGGFPDWARVAGVVSKIGWEPEAPHLRARLWVGAERWAELGAVGVAAVPALCEALNHLSRS